MDGTIINSEPLFDKAWNAIAQHYGQEYNLEIKKQIMGFKAIRAVQHTLDIWGVNDSAEEVLDQIEAIFLEYVKKELSSNPFKFE